MRRTDRRPAQIFQHAATVLAGMASIGLTVAAGTYITNQMADTGHHLLQAAPDPAAPVPASGPGPRPEEPGAAQGRDGRDIADAAPVLTASELPLGRFPAAPGHVVAVSAEVPVAIVPAEPAAPQPAGPAGLGGRLPLLDGAYLGANLATEQPDTYSITVDTNVFSVLGTLLAERPGTASEGNNGTASGGNSNAASVIRLHSDIDVASGEVTFAVSGSALGRRNPAVGRRSDPTSTEGHSRAAVSPGGAPAPSGTMAGGPA
jgi:hypothetical protein